MARILVMSSFVAGSNVGGGLAQKVLPQLGCECVLLPTVLLGRHPGWGAPGGGAVPYDMFSSMADGLIANDIPASCDAVITGYFASPAQVERAAGLISKYFRGRVPVIIDPVIGDWGKGLYISEAVAAAITDHLVPLADVLTPNVFECLELLRRRGDIPAIPENEPDIAWLSEAMAREPAAPAWAVTSVSSGPEIGIMWSDGAVSYRGNERITGPVPNGTGDLVTLLVCKALLDGEAITDALPGIVATVRKAILSSEAGDINTARLFADS